MFKWPSGEVYKGEVHNGKIHGRGVKIWPDGKKYDGDFEDNQITGYGRMQFKLGGQEFKIDQASGYSGQEKLEKDTCYYVGGF